MSTQKTVVIDVVGLTGDLLGGAMPALSRWAAEGSIARIQPSFPALTCTAQADYLTGVPPAVHGVVSNGWYSREDHEVRFWKQSNALVRAPKIWETARALDPSFTCANLFWWFNMYSTADYTVTPRPMYPADGRKIPDVYTKPSNLRDDLQQSLGTFPLFEFWGPRASIRSTEWIAASARHVEQRFNPTLTLIYLPHLDYPLQKHGVDDPANAQDLAAVDRVAGELIAFYEQRGASVVVLSEYGLTNVSDPVHPNRILRERGLLAVRSERGRDVIDPGASIAFAVADHQVAHVYVNDPARLEEIRGAFAHLPGVDAVLGRTEQAAYRVDHERAGDLILVAAPNAWFTYYYWLDDARAPDYARTVDIHRKPGYDPVELFIDPAIRLPAATVGWKLLKRSVGMRSLLDVIPLDARLVRGSHGRPGPANDLGPVLISRSSDRIGSTTLRSTDVHQVLMRHLNLG